MMYDKSIVPEIPGAVAGVCTFADVKDKLIPRYGVKRLPDGAESVVVYLFPYYLGEDVYNNRNVSRYAVPRDYHLVAGGLLERAADALKKEFPDESFVSFTDGSPIPEKTAAALAGLGVIGMNTLLINPEYGSFCFIGEVVTTLEIEPTGRSAGCCEKCGACVRACPAGALQNGFEKEKCFSYITQGRALSDGALREAVEKTGTVWGCDLCQEACPHNAHPALTKIEEFLNSAVPCFSPEDDISDRAYSWRGRDVIEKNLTFLKQERKDTL